MEIKWHDQSRGAVKNERWVSIPSGKALEMLRRKAPDKYSDFVRELNLGREVRTDAYTLRDETVNKAQYMQDLDDDDFHTVTFFLDNVRDWIADEMALGDVTFKVADSYTPFEIKAGVVCEYIGPSVEEPHMTATEVQMRVEEYFKALGKRR